MSKMAPTTQTTPSKAKNHVDEEKTIKRGLTKLEDAFTTDLKEKYGRLLTICNTAAGNTSITNSSHQSVLCEYITSAVRGTYGNSRPKGRGGGPGSSPGPGLAAVSGAGSGVPVWSGLDRKNRCNILRICMKYLMYHYCIPEDDITKILEAMKVRVESWTVAGGKGKHDSKKKNKGSFGRCIKKPWSTDRSGENRLKCKVIKIITENDRGKDETLNPLKSALLSSSGGVSVTCSTASNTHHGSQYVNDCSGGGSTATTTTTTTTSTQPNGTAVGRAAAAGAGNNSDEEDDQDDEEDDDEDEDEYEDDKDDAVVVTSAQSTSSGAGQGISSSSQSLPVGNGKGGKGRKGIFPSFPSLSSFPFDSIHPYLPLVPSILGIITITYFLWKYFGPLGKGGPRFRRAPYRIPGPSVQEQVLDHVQQDSSHGYRLMKERKPRSAPTRTKRSGPVNRRTIIEIHFEVLDECQKGDTQLNQKDFLELLVREFMGSELMEVEQVPKEEVLMEGVPMESVPSLGSGLLV